MAKKSRSSNEARLPEDTRTCASTMMEPPVGDLPDAAETPLEPSMPEAAKEVPETSAAPAAAAAAPTKENKASCTKDELVEDDTVQLKDDASQADLPENDSLKSLDHDTQKLEEGDSLEITPPVEVVKEQDRKRPTEVENDEVGPAKKVVSEVDTEAPVKTVRCEE